RAITRRPASRAFLIEGTMAAESLGVIRNPLAPAAIRLSIASTWDWLSPSTLPAKLESLRPSSLALASAPSFIFTKKGLVFVLVIRPTVTCWAPAPPALRATPSTKAAAYDMRNRDDFDNRASLDRGAGRCPVRAFWYGGTPGCFRRDPNTRPLGCQRRSRE